jgi:excisionase family DNA binding protein
MRKKKSSVQASLVATPVVPESKAAPRLLRIQQAAEYLSATPWFIRSLIWSRAIPFLQLGKRHLIDVRDLDAYVDSQKAAS